MKYALSVVVILIGLCGYQSWHIHELHTDMKDDVSRLNHMMAERDDLEVQLKDMTYQAHPYVKTGQVGPTASKELQCMQLLGLVRTPPAGPRTPPTKPE